MVVRSKGGRSSCGALPFYNLERVDGNGLVGAIGWTGDWEARFWRESDGGVRVRAGMQRTHLRLRPGEEIRTPRILLLSWEGTRDDGQNLLRRFMLTHHAPRRAGNEPRVPVSFSLWGEVREDRQVAKAQWFTEQRIPIDNVWIDAGWFGDRPVQDGANVFNTDWGRRVGDWWPNPRLFPRGLAPVGEAARVGGRDFTLWFESERVREGTVLTREHPEWLLGPIGGNFLFDLGNPEAPRGADRYHRRGDRGGQDQLLPAGFQHGQRAVLAGGGRARPGRHGGDPSHRGAVRVLGRAARPGSPASSSTTAPAGAGASTSRPCRAAFRCGAATCSATPASIPSACRARRTASRPGCRSAREPATRRTTTPCGAPSAPVS